MGRWIAAWKERLGGLGKNITLIHWLVGGATFVVGVLVLVAGGLPTSAKLEVGRPAPWDIKAASAVQIVDQSRWQRAQEQAANQITPIERLSPQSLDISKSKLEQSFSIIRQAQRQHPNGKFSSAEVNLISQKVPLNLRDQTVKALLNSSAPALEQYYTNSEHILSVVMQTGVGEDELKEAAGRIAQEARSLPGQAEAQAEINTELAQAALVPNKFVDYAATQQAKAEAREQVEPIYKTIVPGQVVIREGDIVGEEDLPVLEALGVYQPTLTWGYIFTHGALVFVMLVIVCYYLRAYLPELYANPRLLAGTAALCLVFMVLSRYTVTISPYLLPIAFTSILLAIIVDSRLTLLLVCILGVYAGVMTNTLAAVAIVIFTGMVSVLAVRRAYKRWSVVTASLYVWAINVFIVLVFSLSSSRGFDQVALNALFYGGINGLLPSLIAAGALPVLESALKVTTHIKMLELANPNEPVLHELLTKAPGTYMHSIMVANLAEAAAQAIGADATLCRAGAYYHDIGKMRQPNMFVENQTSQENPQDKLPPSLSAMIVISHVNYGLELAKKYKLPPEITQFIPQHHGTNLASFFYQKAKAQGEEPVFAEDFRYPGPKPQTKETAIVMICDGLEAASRTLPLPNRENLKNLIDKIVGNIINNHQLDECPLSLKDINTVKASILRSLTSHYHNRIPYPDANTLKAQAKKECPAPPAPAAPQPPAEEKPPAEEA